MAVPVNLTFVGDDFPVEMSISVSAQNVGMADERNTPIWVIPCRKLLSADLDARAIIEVWRRRCCRGLPSPASVEEKVVRVKRLGVELRGQKAIYEVGWGALWSNCLSK